MTEKTGELRLYQGIGLLISTLLGSGVFVVPAIVAARSGFYSWLPWLGMTVLMLPILFVFSWLGKEYPHSAGAAYFVRLAFGDRFSKCTSTLYLSVIPVGPPVMVITGANYLASCFGLGSQAVPYLSIVMLAIILAINVFGISIAGTIQFLITVSTLTVLGLVVCSAQSANDAGLEFSGASAGIDGLNIARSMAAAFWCFVGTEAVIHIAPEFRNPNRDFPRAVYFSVLVAVLLYGALSYSVLNFSAFGNEEAMIASLSNVMRQSFGNLGARVIGLVGFTTCLAAVNVYVISFGQLLTSLSQEGTAGAIFSKRSRNISSLVATVSVLALITSTVLIKFACDVGLENIIFTANGIFISIYLMTSLSAVALLPRRHRLLGVLASAFCIVVIICLGGDMLYAASVLAISLLMTMPSKAEDGKRN